MDFEHARQVLVDRELVLEAGDRGGDEAVAGVGRPGDPGELVELVPGELLPGVLGLVVESEAPLADAVLVGDPVVLCDADAPAQDVPRGRAVLHAHHARVDDLQAPVGLDVGARLEALDAVDALLAEVQGLGFRVLGLGFLVRPERASATRRPPLGASPAMCGGGRGERVVPG